MTVTIPVWAFYVLFTYMTIGAFLYLPMFAWDNRFISPRASWWKRFGELPVKRFITGLYIVSMFLWPYMLWYCLRNEIRYGIFKKGK